MSDGFWIVLIGALVAGSCALVGCFLVLRRQALMGDAISHAVLPGIVIAFLITHSRNTLPMLIGAGALGLFTAFLTSALERHGRLQADASLGVTFTWLFALGVILVSAFTGHVDLDAECVLYGEIEYAPLYRAFWGEIDLGPRAFWVLLGVTLANVLFVTLGYKQLKLCAFDPGLAAAVGINAALWHYLLMAFVSITTVGAFESVGAILVVALLIVPPNTAYLLTDRLWAMLTLSVILGALSSAGGYLLASALDSSTSAAIAVVSGMLFILAALFSPAHGAVPRYLRRRRLLASAEALAD
ncbi:MAG: metal ABC transporter permease [Candidatus Hydrogenedentes bacterium]|nr:metal ABC transporter permease [Candidatus Hydrogenedentota bacterium]